MSITRRSPAVFLLCLGATGCAGILGLDSGTPLGDDDAGADANRADANVADADVVVETTDASFLTDAAPKNPAVVSDASTPTCASGTADCNGNSKDGCETNLNDPAHCGSCTKVCPLLEMCMSEACCLGTHAACTNNSDCCSDNCGPGKSGCH